MAEKHIVVQGATCQCKFSVEPKIDVLKVKTQTKHFANDKEGKDKLIATHKDIGQTFEKNTFGKCKMQPNGSGDFLPCQALVTQWQEVYEKVTLEENKGNLLLEDSIATCPIGGPGCISIKNHGQTGEGSPQQVKQGNNVAQNQANPIFADFVESQAQHKAEEREIGSEEKREIVKLETYDINDKLIAKGTKFHYGKVVNTTLHTTGMVGETIHIELWEDDAMGAGHSDENRYNKVDEQLAKVGEKGIAEVQFTIKPDFAKIATAHNAKEGKTHEYYFLAYCAEVINTSANINIYAPEYKEEKKRVIVEKLKGIEPKPVQEPKQKVKALPEVEIIRVIKQPKPATPAVKEPKKITYIYFTDDKNHKIENAKYGSTIRAHIGSTGLIGRQVKIKVYDHEVMGKPNFLGEAGVYKISASPCYIDIVLTKEMQENGGNFWYDEVYADIEILETKAHIVSTQIEVKTNSFKVDIPDNKTKSKVGDVPKEKFDKVKVKAEEAVLYISSEIATEIKVDKNGKLVSYPDYGAYNGQEEYKENEKIYCKKISSTQSAFPTFKAYIYRGNSIGEAVKKLKQDLKFKTHENAEATVLEVARHSALNNKNYKKNGSVPPNTSDKLYRLKYKKGTNDSGKISYRYRLVDDNTINLPSQEDLKKEIESGTMTIGSRSSISIDPWNSEYLIGCVGIRDTGGGYHSSFSALTKEQKKIYKNKYHCINNYLEGIIPELTGVYGRRGFSDSDNIIVAESTYDHEVKVFVLVDPLPEIDNCKCKKFTPKEKIPFYDSFGTKAINYIDTKTTSNKFKGLYMIAQKRKETGFLLVNLGKNPMNIKGKYVTVPGEKFANFSTEDKGFQGYLDLLDSNYNDAYKSLFDDSKTIDDFTAGLEDAGKLGAYATGKAQGGLTGTDDYKLKVKELFNGIKKDYLEIYECKLCKEKDLEKKKKIQEDIDLLKKLK